jgi:hypothetical protein
MKNEISIGCFGSIRPLKNQLIQALAAVEFARTHGKKLKYHINGSRIENGDNILKNIRNVFKNLDPEQYELVEHEWLNHKQFIELIRSMDVCLQVSMTETFNIVTSDAVSQDIPVVVSSEISWVHPFFYADPTSVKDISKKIHCALKFGKVGTSMNQKRLKIFNRKAERHWLDYLK